MPETGPLTRSVNEKFEKLFPMMAEMKAGLEDKIEAGQEEMRSGQERLEQEMRSGEERLEQEIRSGKEEIKSQIQAHTESQVEEIKIHVVGWSTNLARNRS
ncbi:hypothetical protein AVEN_197912-1 [Araneus ventricosus]|uniref:Uncharacterized protein n=1 Tax=Araneus ventricosus TaxID=182803 RepID=A0A4Y2CJ87_ARAVE|nr:hypothetical protein AVEN_197912-1 [Araneus ventricosus]